MQTINILETQYNLSQLVDAIENGYETEIIIAHNGRPAAKLVPMNLAPIHQRIGIAKGLLTIPDSIDTSNEEVAQLFMGGSTF